MKELQTDEHGRLVTPKGYREDWETLVRYDDARESQEEAEDEHQSQIPSQEQ